MLRYSLSPLDLKHYMLVTHISISRIAIRILRSLATLILRRGVSPRALRDNGGTESEHSRRHASYTLTLFRTVLVSRRHARFSQSYTTPNRRDKPDARPGGLATREFGCSTAVVIATGQAWAHYKGTRGHDQLCDVTLAVIVQLERLRST